MNNEIHNGVEKTKEVLTGATAAVAEGAKESTTRMNKLFHLALNALPATSERIFGMMLGRVGLARRSSGLGGVGLFMGGFVAGSVATAFTTPVSGPELRKRVLALVSGLIKDTETEPTVADLAKQAIENDKAGDRRAPHMAMPKGVDGAGN